jgi:hypothetical protein
MKTASGNQHRIRYWTPYSITSVKRQCIREPELAGQKDEHKTISYA